MSARPSPGTSGQAVSKSATGSYTQAKRQRRRNTQRSDSAVNGRSRSSVTADRQVELTAAVSLAATTGGFFFLADEGQDEGAAVRRGAVLEAIRDSEITGRRTVVLGATSPENDVAGHLAALIFAINSWLFWFPLSG